MRMVFLQYDSLDNKNKKGYLQKRFIHVEGILIRLTKTLSIAK